MPPMTSWSDAPCRPFPIRNPGPLEELLLICPECRDRLEAEIVRDGDAWGGIEDPPK